MHMPHVQKLLSYMRRNNINKIQENKYVSKKHTAEQCFRMFNQCVHMNITAVLYAQGMTQYNEASNE